MVRPRRPVIKSYSTKCQPPWRVALNSSKIYSGLLLALTSVAGCALFTTEASLALRFISAAFLVGLAAWQFTISNLSYRLSHDANEKSWSLSRPNHATITGPLIGVGYRSSWLLILVIQSENTRYHYCPIWVDQLSGSDFSYLHYQLLFNTSTPIKRDLKSVLSGIIGT